MSNTQIKQALIMAAGFAKRMRPITDNLPKPLVKLGDKPLLSHILDHLQDAGVERVIINGHHAIDKLQAYMPMAQSQYPSLDLILSAEDDILETGGGAVYALPLLDKNEPFFMINGDAYWVDGTTGKTLSNLQQAWQNQPNADILLSLQDTSAMSIGAALGDYNILETGQAVRSIEKKGTHMFNGIRIVHPRILDGYDVSCFSFLDVMDKAERLGSLYGLHHEGEWYHISTPQDLIDTNEALFGKTA